MDGTYVEFHDLDEHHTTADSHIPGVVARKGRRRKGSGGQRHGDGKLPHNRFPFQLRFTSRQTSYSSLWFHASQQIANLLPKSRTLCIAKPKISLQSEGHAPIDAKSAHRSRRELRTRRSPHPRDSQPPTAPPHHPPTNGAHT